MKELLSRIKSTLQNDTDLKAYIKKVEIVAPRAIPDLTTSILPHIGIAPINSPEIWNAQKKEQFLGVEIYLTHWFQAAEKVIMGDTVKKGLLEMEIDLKDALRNNYFTSGGVPYLSHPTAITGADYNTLPYGDSYFLLVLTLSLTCRRLLDVL